jgi:hypothetical protein
MVWMPTELWLSTAENLSILRQKMATSIIAAGTTGPQVTRAATEALVADIVGNPVEAAAAAKVRHWPRLLP